ncbi:hypothetical protein [Ferrimonas sp. SCSIO 43195]|uniref:hypothetical protein n=1 Tax=Ferrimonas sp. SCSIO 43195 TaxID=2822844 RepID=UPI002075125A|nr:hypothetical protein [Ferrimonas sp. SCSIO 43195]USD37120.1 hypothetical protein J8Z22_19380 [Ferrimonas sp. SCSIO 43195]
MKVCSKLFLLSAIAATLTGCGGGGGSASPALNISGKAIDGYISGATVYLDLNFNKRLDSNEPSAVTETQGEFDLSVPEIYKQCAQYVPVVVDVPVGAIDSDFPDTPIEEAYSMVFPPQFALSTDQDLLNLTPLTSVVWSQVEQELADNRSGELSCDSLLKEQALREEIAQRLQEQEWRVANRYNVTVDELYSDYIASNNDALHQLAQDLVPGLQKSYEQTVALLKQYPNAELAWVEFFLGIWDSHNNNYDDQWYRYEMVQTSSGNFNSITHVMSEDLETKLQLHNKESMVTTQRDGVNIEQTLTLEKGTSNYHCAISEWLETLTADSSGVRNTLYAEVADWPSCNAAQVVGEVTQALVTKNYQDGALLSYTEHTYNPGNDSGFTDLIGVTDTVTAADLSPVRDAIDTDFYSEQGHGADHWSRVRNEFSDQPSQPSQIMTSHNNDGQWQRQTNYRNGTHKTECGDSEQTLSESQCQGN